MGGVLLKVAGDGKAFQAKAKAAFAAKNGRSCPFCMCPRSPPASA